MDKGLYDKYLVLDRAKNKSVPDVFVLKPSTDNKALKALKYYAELNKGTLLGSELTEWLKGFEEYRCKMNRVCPIVGSTICCCHCPHLDLCIEQNESMCLAVRCGEVIEIDECEYRKLVE